MRPCKAAQWIEFVSFSLALLGFALQHISLYSARPLLSFNHSVHMTVGGDKHAIKFDREKLPELSGTDQRGVEENNVGKKAGA